MDSSRSSRWRRAMRWVGVGVGVAAAIAVWMAQDDRRPTAQNKERPEAASEQIPATETTKTPSPTPVAATTDGTASAAQIATLARVGVNLEEPPVVSDVGEADGADGEVEAEHIAESLPENWPVILATAVDALEVYGTSDIGLEPRAASLLGPELYRQWRQVFGGPHWPGSTTVEDIAFTNVVDGDRVRVGGTCVFRRDDASATFRQTCFGTLTVDEDGGWRLWEIRLVDQGGEW